MKYDGDTKHNTLSQEKKQQPKLSIYCNYDIKHYMKRAVKNSKMITALEWIQKFFFLLSKLSECYFTFRIKTNYILKHAFLKVTYRIISFL